MTKEEFLRKLKIKISILEEREVIDILEEYSEHIDEKIKAGVSEKEAIKEFGNIDELAANILSAFKVNKNYSESIKENFINDIVETTKDVFNKTIKVLSHGTTNDIIKLVLYIVIILIIVVVLKIPFIILERLFDNAFDLLPDVIDNLFDTILAVVLNISYIIVAFLFLIKMLKERFLDNCIIETEVVKETETKKKSKTKSSDKKEDLIIEKQIEKKTVYKNERRFLDSISDLLIIFIKIFSAFILIPCIFGIVCSSIGIASILLFSIKYYFFFGPIIVCIGLLIGSIWITELLFRFISNKKGSFLRSFITFITALILCGSGIGISVIEFSNLEYIDIEQNSVLLETYKFDTKDYKKVGCFECSSINKVSDNTMKDGEYTVEVYGLSFHIPDYEVYESEGKVNGVYFHCITDDVETFKSMIEGIKEGKIYNYKDKYSSVAIRITANDKTLNNISIAGNYWAY